MSSYVLKNDEILLYGSIVEFDGCENVKFSLTNKNLIFEKEKGIFQKKLRVIKKIEIDQIKMYNDEVQIRQKKSTLNIQSFYGDVCFTFGSKLEAKKVYNQIIHIKTGEDLANRTAKKLSNFYNAHKEVFAMISGLSLVAYKYRGKIKDAVVFLFSKKF